MSWVDDNILLVRAMIGDTESPVEYSDTRLTDMVWHAAYFVVQRVNFTNDYEVTIATQVINTDPISDTNFMALVSLKARAMILNSEFRTASTKAMSIKDGPSSIDARGIADAKKAIAAQAQKEYEDAEFEYMAGNYGVGEAIVSPFRIQYTDEGGRTTY